MSESGDDRGKEVIVEDDCPLCLEPLPPFWDLERRVIHRCCGKYICRDCHDEKMEFLHRAVAEGSIGREEKRLAGFCPMCRAELPEDECRAMIMQRKLDEGRLPLHSHRDLAVIYLKGAEGVEVDVERGKEIMMLGAEKGDPHCQHMLGNCYDEGSYGLPKSVEDAKRWWSAATEQGHAVAEYNLAVTFKEEGNNAEYLQSLKGSASKGFDEACYNLGVAHYSGAYGLQSSTEEAIRVLTPAAERGDAESMGLLGIALCKPDPQLPPPLPRDNPNFVKGVHWLRRAAEAGNQIAVTNLVNLEKHYSSNCFRCAKKASPEKAFLRCSRCRAAWYCSKDCQVQHWNAKEGGHKQCCIKWG